MCNRKCLKPIKLKYPRQKLKAIKDLVIEPVNINNRKRKKTKTDTEASKRRKKGKGLDSIKSGQSWTGTVYSGASQIQNLGRDSKQSMNIEHFLFQL